MTDELMSSLSKLVAMRSKADKKTKPLNSIKVSKKIYLAGREIKPVTAPATTPATPVALGQRRKELTKKINAEAKPGYSDLLEYQKVSQQIDKQIEDAYSNLGKKFDI